MAGTKLEYARTLAQVAETATSPLSEPMLAFGRERPSDGLKDRIQRLLVPGYSPGARLTWQALLGMALIVGSGLAATRLRARTLGKEAQDSLPPPSDP